MDKQPAFATNRAKSFPASFSTIANARSMQAVQSAEVQIELSIIKSDLPLASRSENNPENHVHEPNALSRDYHSINQLQQGPGPQCKSTRPAGLSSEHSSRTRGDSGKKSACPQGFQARLACQTSSRHTFLIATGAKIATMTDVAQKSRAAKMFMTRHRSACRKLRALRIAGQDRSGMILDLRAPAWVPVWSAIARPNDAIPCRGLAAGLAERFRAAEDRNPAF